MDIGTLLLMLGVSYGFGLLWYDLLPGRLPERIWRVAAYPFLGLFVAHALSGPWMAFDPGFGGIHLITAAVGSLAGVLVDWIITTARHPAIVHHLEPRMEPRPV